MSPTPDPRRQAAADIRAYFAALRHAARSHGGAIAFIEEIDAIATTRQGMRATA